LEHIPRICDNPEQAVPEVDLSAHTYGS